MGGADDGAGVRPSDQAFRAAAKIISERLDRERAPWLKSKRAATAVERDVFARATASIRAMGAIQTARRMESSARQEKSAREAARKAGYKAVIPPATLTDPIEEMPPGSYATVSRRLAETNMDIPVRLPDGHGTGLVFLALGSESLQLGAELPEAAARSPPEARAVGRKREVVSLSDGRRAGRGLRRAPLDRGARRRRLSLLGAPPCRPDGIPALASPQPRCTVQAASTPRSGMGRRSISLGSNFVRPPAYVLPRSSVTDSLRWAASASSTRAASGSRG